MKISVITVCYNAASHIDECLRSVAVQSHPDVEHIVIDGGSTDNTLQIVQRYPHIAKIVSEPDRGIYDAMNKGLVLASGDYVLFLNADDRFWHAASLSRASELMAEQPAADVYYGWLEVRSPDRAPTLFKPPPPEEAPELMVCGCLPHQSTLARPSVFERTGPFDLRYRYHADYDWFLKILADPTISVRLLTCTIASFQEGGASSALIKAQPEAYAIQNTAALFADATAWDKKRIAILQQTLLNERIENARLRAIIRRARTRARFVSGRIDRLASADAIRRLKQIWPSRVTDALRQIAHRYRGLSH